MWVKEFFLPYVKNEVNIIDFWAYDGLEAEVEVIDPVAHPNGQPNITWIAKYKNKQEKCGATIQILMRTFTKMHVF